MRYFRDLTRKLRFKLMMIEDAKYTAAVGVIRLVRNRMLADHPGPDKEAIRIEFETEDAEADANNRASYETFLFTEVGKALSTWAALETVLVSIASMLLTNSMQKTGVVMYSIVNFGTWLNIITELYPHEELYTHLKPKWDKLTSRLRALKDIRDRLAHHSAYRPDTPVPYFELTTIAPSPYDARAKSLRYKPLSHPQIAEFNSDALHLMKDLEALMAEMEKVRSAHIAALDAAIDSMCGPGAYDRAVAAAKAIDPKVK